ncbi:eukaryotic translation initiation factor 2B subunit alpha [Dermatophagoides farinae]|uniref:Translation initiation factor eIF2B subunit alpha n=1 Tax=Dermatophagoides farinae TaxID=6954 RepID=A0A922L7I8_DERFA|nr:translation initiation factor eIF-2B subunit alpha-like [Dermatophagoides farinae]KAH7639231.1 translation initiation factor eif-2b subunit alpha-like protein [Dermatophagoides farinae]KAH9522218.1 Translation initiation factor [Dermatophagoides farinae]
MADFDLEKFYKSINDDEKSSAILTLQTLMEFLRMDTSRTANELSRNLRDAIDQLKKIDPVIEVESVAEIYFRFITLSAAKFDDFQELKEELSRRSKLYMDKVSKSRQQLAKVAQKFITNDSTILVHSFSRAVLETLLECRNQNKCLRIFVTESAPDNRGRELCAQLKLEGFEQVTLILDSAVGSMMDCVDLVLVGAEGVTESGGIINKIGTYQIAICAKAHNKTFYVLAENYKFIRLYPLSQSDIPDRIRFRTLPLTSMNRAKHECHPCVDYTPPNYITLLLTDLGPLTTAAVCDMLVQLYT